MAGSVCLKIEIHKIYEIHMPKYRNPPTKYEIHCLKIEIHKGHEIHSKATLAKYRNPRNPQTVRYPHWQGSQQTKKQLCCCVLTAEFYTLNWIDWIELCSCKAVTFLASLLSRYLCAHAMRNRRRLNSFGTLSQWSRSLAFATWKWCRRCLPLIIITAAAWRYLLSILLFRYCHNCTVLIVLVLLLGKCANPRPTQSVCCIMMFFVSSNS